MKVSKFTVNPFGENVYLLWNESSKNVIIVDPGMMNETERNAVTNFIESLNSATLLKVSERCAPKPPRMRFF